MQAKLDVAREDRVIWSEANFVVGFNPEPPAMDIAHVRLR